MEVDFLENFIFLENLLRKNEILTVKKLVKFLNRSYDYSKQILHEFFISRKNMDNFIIIFQVELLENSCLKTFLIPSYSQLLSSVLNNLEIIDFSVFSIFNKEKNFELKDLSVFYDENDIQINFFNDGTSFENLNSCVLKNANIQNNEKDLNHIQLTQPPEQNITIPTTTKNNTQTSSKPTSKNIEKPKKSTKSKKLQDKIIFPIVTKPSMDDRSTKNVINTIVSRYEEVGSNSVGKEKVLSHFETNLNIKDQNQSEEDEELFYDGKLETSIKEDPSMNVKRKASPGLEDLNEKRKKDEIKMKNEQQSFEKGQSSMNSLNEKNQVKKIRKVKKTTYAKDEKGYLHCIDEYVDEEYWSDELKQVSKKVSNIEEKKTKNKKVFNGQGNILNFFKNK